MALEIVCKNYPVTLRFDTSYWRKSAIDGSFLKYYNNKITRSYLLEIEKIELNLEDAHENFIYTQSSSGLVRSIAYLWRGRVKHKKIPKQGHTPINKSGYNLILFDDFNNNSIDGEIWNISSPNNDGHPNCLEGGDFSANPNNVSIYNNEYAKVDLTTDNMNGCYSMGEIKTFRIPDDKSQFYNYSFSPNTYIEIRAKLPKGQNIGSAAWLWNNFPLHNEIDIWETSDLYRKDHQVIQTYIYYDTIEQYLAFDQTKIDLYNEADGAMFEVDENFINYGIEWSNEYIIWTVMEW